MKYFPLVWAGLWRNTGRTIFTLVSIVVAFALYGVLQGIDTTLKQSANRGRLNVLVTRSPTGLPLPLAYLSQIEALHGVTRVAPRSLFIGSFQSARNPIIVLPIEPDSFFAMNAIYSVPPTQGAAFRRTQTGALVARGLAERLAWKIGDEIPIHALNAPKKDGTSDWTFQLVGTFDTPGEPTRDQPLLLMNYSYFDNARGKDAGTVLFYQEEIADASQATAISTAIDDLFNNSPDRTRTETERSDAQGQLAQIGDLDFFVEAIVAAAFATLLLLVGSTLMQAYRERIHEFAVMKTLGFTDWGVSTLVLSEALLLTVASAVLGLLVAYGMLAALALLTRSMGGASILGLHWIVVSIGLVLALLLALASALPAAWRAQRISITAALAAR
jgi:putative ABC transport system permease protein